MPPIAVKRITKAAASACPNGRECNDQHHGAEQTRKFSVALFENITDGVLPEGADFCGEKINDGDAGPGPGGHPHRAPARAKRILRSGDEGTGTDPGADKGKDHLRHTETAAGDHHVVLRFDFARLVKIVGRQCDQISQNHEHVGVHRRIHQRV
jgi:hypothetical protein